MRYKKYFTLSYDDGIEQDKKLIQILNRYGIKATFNLSSGLFGQESYIGRIGDLGCLEINKEKKDMKASFNPVEHFIIPEDEAVQVYEGFEVASHGYMHEFYLLSSKNTVDTSISQDVRHLSDTFGCNIVGHAYPKGSMTKNAVIALNNNGLIYGRGVKSTGSFNFPKNPLRYHPTCWHGSKNVFNILEKFIEAEATTEDLLCYIWGHSYEFDFGTERNSWERIERICEKIAGRDDIVYCTNAEAFQRI